GIGGTLAGNALSLAAMRATLAHVLTDAAHARTIPPAPRVAEGGERGIAARRLPWRVTRAGGPARGRVFPRAPPARPPGAAGGGRRSGARPLHAPRGAQPRHPADAVPQHGSPLPTDHGRGHRPAHARLRGERRSAPRLNVLFFDRASELLRVSAMRRVHARAA